jgi:hypothetical protein
MNMKKIDSNLFFDIENKKLILQIEINESAVNY